MFAGRGWKERLCLLTGRVAGWVSLIRETEAPVSCPCGYTSNDISPGLSAATVAGQADGAAVFLKDDKTIRVDATGLPARDGPSGDSRTDLAYTIATDILACWAGWT